MIDTSIYQRFHVHTEWKTFDELITGIMQCLSSDISSIISDISGASIEKVKVDSNIRELGIDAFAAWKVSVAIKKRYGVAPYPINNISDIVGSIIAS